MYSNRFDKNEKNVEDEDVIKKRLRLKRDLL